VASALSDADRRWIPVCVAGEVAAYVGYIMAYRVLARVDDGPALDAWTATRVVIVGFGATFIGASAGGLAADFWALRRAGASAEESSRRVLALNTLEWAALSLAAMAAALAVLAGRGKGAPAAMTLSWLLAVPACVGAGWWVSRGERGRRLSRPPEGRPSLGRDPRRWPAWAWHTARRGLAAAIGGLVLLRDVIGQPRHHGGALLGYPLYWAGDVLCLYAAVRAFGGHPALAPLLLAYASGYVASALPLPAGGAGGIEAALSLTLHAVGVPLATAVAGVLVYRAVTLWLPLLPALLVAPGLRRLQADLRDTPRAEAEA
jgi:uncharacterized membrane protein YbhN (UPF0104 family)